MTQMRIAEAADLLDVSADTVRRMIANQELVAHADAAGRWHVDALSVAEYARRRAGDPAASRTSARNRFPGIVTDVRVDGVMAQVELQCGPHRVVSLMSAEAAGELGLSPGVRATAVVKATTVIVEGS
jgi:molybdopterin-binding protein